MHFTKILILVLAAVVTVVPAAAKSSRYYKEQGSNKKCKADTSILELVFCASGGPDSGVDDRKQDFDILRELIIAADLVEDVSGLEGVTLFAPNDSAFNKLAEDLGYNGGYDELEIVLFLVEQLSTLGDPLAWLIFILRYHVGTKEYSCEKLEKGKTVSTLAEAFIESKSNKKGNKVLLVDNEPKLDHPRIHNKYRDLETSQGYFHTITRVLLPIAFL